MAKKMQRVQVGKRRFGFTYGLSWFAVKEYSRGLCQCDHSQKQHGQRVCLMPDCACKYFKPQKLLSFAVGRPAIINHRVAREIIKEKLEEAKGK